MKNACRLPRALLLLAIVSLVGCDLLDNPEVICTAELVFGLEVAVQDSSTGAPAASGAQLVARDGTWVDAVGFPPDRPDLEAQELLSAAERPGTYTVTVSKPGFRDWQRTGIVVTADECHVHPVELTARLQRAP